MSGLCLESPAEESLGEQRRGQAGAETCIGVVKAGRERWSSAQHWGPSARPLLWLLSGDGSVQEQHLGLWAPVGKCHATVHSGRALGDSAPLSGHSKTNN